MHNETRFLDTFRGEVLFIHHKTKLERSLAHSTTKRAHFMSSYDFDVTEISGIVFSYDNGLPVAKFMYARILFYEDNRNQFSWFLFAQFSRSHRSEPF